MLVPPGKEEHRAASYGSRCDHAVPRPEPMLTQESTMGSRNTWTAAPIPAAMYGLAARRSAEKLLAILTSDPVPTPRKHCLTYPEGRGLRNVRRNPLGWCGGEICSALDCDQFERMARPCLFWPVESASQMRSGKSSWRPSGSLLWGQRGVQATNCTPGPARRAARRDLLLALELFPD